MQRDRLYFVDIVEACEAIQSFVNGKKRGDLDRDDLLVSAILHKLTVIGEAAGRVSVERRERHPEIPWRQLGGMRNYVVHAYFNLDLDIVWQTVTADIPSLRATILQASQDEFGAGHPNP